MKKCMRAAAVLAFAAVMAAAGAAGAEEAITIKFSHPDPEASVLQVGLEAFKKDIEQRSGGTIKVDIYPANQLGSLTEVIECIQMGCVDMAMSATSYVSNFCPEVAIFDMPFLMDDDAHSYRCVDGDVGKFLADILAESDIDIIAWWPMGFRNVTTSKNAKISTIDDFKGKSIRTMANQIHQELFRALGADPVPMDWGELFTALQQGAVDGQENPYNMIYNNNVYEVQHYLYPTGHAYSITAMMMSPSFAEQLTDEQLAMIRESVAVATKIYRDAYEKTTAENLEKLIGEKGMEFVDLDKAQLREKARVCYDNHPELAELVEMVDSYRE